MESRTQLKTVKITLNIFAVYICFHGIDAKCQDVKQEIGSHESRQQNLKITTVFQEI